MAGLVWHYGYRATEVPQQLRVKTHWVLMTRTWIQNSLSSSRRKQMHEYMYYSDRGIGIVRHLPWRYNRLALLSYHLGLLIADTSNFSSGVTPTATSRTQISFQRHPDFYGLGGLMDENYMYLCLVEKPCTGEMGERM